MIIANTSVPVTVLPSPHHGGLGITRSLGRLGIPVFNVDATRWGPSFFSRYCRGSFVWDLDRAEPLESLDYLLKVGQRIGQRSILIPATDGAALPIAGYAAQLAKYFIFHDQSAPLVQSLCSKKHMYGLARRFGVPVPASVFPQTRSDVAGCPERLGLPLMIKALQGFVWNPDSKTKIFIRNIGEFQEISSRIADSSIPDLLVQEYIPGGEDTLWILTAISITAPIAWLALPAENCGNALWIQASRVLVSAKTIQRSRKRPSRSCIKLATAESWIWTFASTGARANTKSWM